MKIFLALLLIGLTCTNLLWAASDVVLDPLAPFSADEIKTGLAQLENKFVSDYPEWANYTEQERLTTALALMNRLPELREVLGMNAEEIHKIKTRQMQLPEKERERISEALTPILKIAMADFLVHQPQRPAPDFFFQIYIKHIFRGLSAAAIAYVSLWTAVYFQAHNIGSMALFLNSVGLISSLYAFYTPFRILKNLIKRAPPAPSTPQSQRPSAPPGEPPNDLVTTWAPWSVLSSKGPDGCELLLAKL